MVETLYLVGIDTGPSEMLRIYSSCTKFLNPVLIPLTKQAQQIFGGEVRTMDFIHRYLSKKDLVLVGGQREEFLKPISKLSCFKAYLMEYMGDSLSAPISAFDVNISCSQERRKNSGWIYTSNPFFLSELEKLRKIKQPKNKKAIFFLQASDDPEDERRSISSLRLFIQKNIFSFSDLTIRLHPNSFLSAYELVLNLKKEFGIEASIYQDSFSLADIYKSYEMVASHCSSVTLHGMLSGLCVFHSIDPDSLTVTGEEPFFCKGKSIFKESFMKSCRDLDDILFDRWAKKVRWDSEVF